MKLTIQIVNFRSRQFLWDCLFSIRKNLPSGIEAEVLIVNNDETDLDEIPDDIKSGTNIRVLEIRKNIGFGKAHNAGFRRSRGEYVLFLNPDTKILPGALERLLSSFGRDEKTGVVGPALVDSGNVIQSECFGACRTPLSTIMKKIIWREHQRMSPSGEVFEADWVSGGAMLVRRDVFEKTGGFDENYFMYFEDVDFCLRVKKSGYKVVVNPAAWIFHQGGKSFESEREKKKHYYASQVYYLKKHFGPVAAGAVKLLRLPYYVKNVYFKR